MTNNFSSELIAVAAQYKVRPSVVSAILEGEAKFSQTTDGWQVTAPTGETGTFTSAELAAISQCAERIRGESFAAAVKRKLERGD